MQGESTMEVLAFDEKLQKKGSEHPYSGCAPGVISIYSHDCVPENETEAPLLRSIVW